MKTILILAGLWFGLNLGTAAAQVVKDPLLDYYQYVKAGGGDNDEEPHYTQQTPIYYFEADLTGDGRKSFFITDEESKQGPHGGYQWSVYYPLASGGYQKAAVGISMSKYGPAYIGSVSEIQGYGVVDSAKHVVSVQYLSAGKIKIAFLGKNQEAEKEDYPQYFSSPVKWQIQKTTLAQLAQKYAGQ